jgi:hypothetical protein
MMYCTFIVYDFVLGLRYRDWRHLERRSGSG